MLLVVLALIVLAGAVSGHFFDTRVATFAVQSGVADERHATLRLSQKSRASCSFSFLAERTPPKSQAHADTTNTNDALRLVAQLENICLRTNVPNQYWQTEICLGKSVRQFNDDSGVSVALGWFVPSASATLAQEFKNGDVCRHDDDSSLADTERTTTVTFACDPHAEQIRIAKIKERGEGSCIYDAVVAHKSLCSSTVFPVEYDRAMAISQDWMLRMSQDLSGAISCSAYAITRPALNFYFHRFKMVMDAGAANPIMFIDSKAIDGGRIPIEHLVVDEQSVSPRADFDGTMVHLQARTLPMRI